MSHEHLLLSSAKVGVLVRQESRLPQWFKEGESFSWVRIAALAVGVLMVFVGLANLLSKVFVSIPQDVAATAFAPGIVAIDPSILASIVGNSPATTTPIIPNHLTIPSIGVDAKVEQVGVKEDGTMQNPSSFATVGWYKYGAQPGAGGHAVIAGHVNNALGLAGVFTNLATIGVGEKILISDKNGKTLTYIVESKTTYDSASAPREELFGLSGPSTLVLITCDGDWIPQARSYDKRLVVLARLVG